MIVSIVKLMDFKPQTACNTLFREPSQVKSHLKKFVFSPKKKKENTLNFFIIFLTNNKELKKNVESFVKAIYK